MTLWTMVILLKFIYLFMKWRLSETKRYSKDGDSMEVEVSSTLKFPESEKNASNMVVRI